MTAKQRNIFTRSKPLMNIYSSVDHEGKEVEVREDAEQLVKWHEISEALVTAGYYRAQLQGLSAFDKIVGGLTWCIELCDIDVDITLSFEENLTIGKKIALTEKIVKVLPKMKCPYTIEPHQIQGLDFINIYPLMQWLIKYSSEFREVKEDELRRFAVMQYEKSHMFESDRSMYLQQDKLLKNLVNIMNLYKPCRVRKRKGGFPESALEQVNATLSEYDQRMLMHVTTNKETSKNDEGLDFLYDYEKTLADPSEITTQADKYDHNSNHDIAETKIHYAVLQSELTGEVPEELELSEKLKYSEDIDRLSKAIDVIEEDVVDFKNNHTIRMENSKQEYEKIVYKLRTITSRLTNSSDQSDKNVKTFFKTLKELAQERTELLQIIQNREKQYEKLNQELRVAQNPDFVVEEPPLTTEELKEYNQKEEKLKTYISKMRLELARLNREVLRFTTAIDEMPGTAELLQYEKRFMELYNQVASKHRETKQYYIFYNTLYEVKLYTSKELSLLNSILDNYDQAMSSAKTREEFMKQFESIVDWVNQTVKKVEEKFRIEKERKTNLHNEYSELLEIQRQYAAALKKLAEERQKINRQKPSKLT